MQQPSSTLATPILLVVCALALLPVAAAHEGEAQEGHNENHESVDREMHEDDRHHELDEMLEMHRGHDHEHGFEVMDRLSPEQSARVLTLMRDVGLALPPMDPEHGRELFLEKGCIVCHRVNGVGGDIGPSLNADDMPQPMNAFEFAARMWRGAPAMTELQEEVLGDFITLSGQQLADIIAFAHDEQEQAKLAAEQVPSKYRELIQDE